MHSEISNPKSGQDFVGGAMQQFPMFILEYLLFYITDDRWHVLGSRYFTKGTKMLQFEI